MPFDDDFELVYGRFIEPIFNSDFDVARAKDIESQRNILQDILDGIESSDLIVADLTGLNANVFYELGLAHAFDRKVILLTQDIGEVPFDLKSYRLIEYSTHFVRIEEARSELTKYAKGFLDGSIEFGSPVTDYRPSGEDTSTPIDGTSVEDAEWGSRYFDHQVAFAVGYTRIAEILRNSIDEMVSLNHLLLRSASELNELSSLSEADIPIVGNGLSRSLGGRIRMFNGRMRDLNREYAELLRTTEDSLEFLVAFRSLDHESPSSSNRLVSQFPVFERNAISAREAYIDLSPKIDDLPRIDKRFTTAVVRASDELRAMAKKIDVHFASVSRIRQRYGRSGED